MKKVLMYSGGMDSWLIDKLWKPDVKVFVDVGTSSSYAERVRLPEDVKVHKLDLSAWERKGQNYFLPLRNLFLVAIGSYYGNIICLGATGSSTHYDKSTEFAHSAGRLLSFLWSEDMGPAPHPVQIEMPYASYTKPELLNMYAQAGGDLHTAFKETFSCYNPTLRGEPCWSCTSCLKKAQAFVAVGYGVPDYILNKLETFKIALENSGGKI